MMPLLGLEPTPVEQRASFYAPGFPEWALDQLSARKRADFGAADSGRWFRARKATPAQIYPNCFMYDYALMVMDRICDELGDDAIPPGYWLDPNGAYERFDDARHGNRTQGGQMLDPFRWFPEREGWFADVRNSYAQFAYKPEYVERMLAVTPICIGFAIHDGWFSPAHNGYIEPRLPNPRQGHAVALVDRMERDGTGYGWFALQWGLNVGFRGYACMSDEAIQQAALSDCIALYLPEGVGNWWQDKLVKF